MADKTPKQESPLKNLDPNSAAALSYLVPPFTGVAIFLVEKEDKFIRFHSFQSILFGIILVALSSLLGAIRWYMIGSLLLTFFRLGAFALWLYLIWEAYNGREYELPYLGQIAKDQMDRKPIKH